MLLGSRNQTAIERSPYTGKTSGFRLFVCSLGVMFLLRKLIEEYYVTDSFTAYTDPERHNSCRLSLFFLVLRMVCPCKWDCESERG